MGASDLAFVKSSNNESESATQKTPKEVESGSSSPPSSSGTETSNIVQTSGKDDERKYLTGLKLYLVVIAVTLVSFLMLLDTAIIVTVCHDPYLFN